uniref:Putative acyl--CoA ligase YtcI n=1 Tax=Lygus hesperus TaxID=30085 RepID=A0A0A9YKW6_LYGHE
MQTLSIIRQNRLMLRRPSKLVRAACNILLGREKKQFGNELRLVILLGNTLEEYQSNLLADLDVFVIHSYGCMEAGGLVASDVDVPNRFKALPGVEIRVVNDRNEIVAPGDMGELLV